jgi:hypothetical protein
VRRESRPTRLIHLPKVTGAGAIIGKNKERWEELCSQAATEQDPEKLLGLITEIKSLLEAKRLRLAGEASGTESG